jgi:hypothetical protein
MTSTSKAGGSKRILPILMAARSSQGVTPEDLRLPPVSEVVLDRTPIFYGFRDRVFMDNVAFATTPIEQPRPSRVRAGRGAF